MIRKCGEIGTYRQLIWKKKTTRISADQLIEKSSFRVVYREKRVVIAVGNQENEVEKMFNKKGEVY